MKLRAVHVKNYRCLADVSVDMTDLTILLGPNSAGKSSLLHALAFFFEGDELEPADVFGGGDQSISVECTFDDVNDADRAALGPYAAGTQVVLRRSWKPGDEQKLTGRGRRSPAFGEVRTKSGRERTAAYKVIREQHADLGLPPATTISAVDQAMLTFEQENPTRCDIVDDEDASQLFGYKSVGKSKLADRFPFVFVPAISDAASEAVEKRGSLLSRLLTAVAEQRATANEGLKAIETEARTKYEAAISTSHGPVLEDLGRRLSQQIRRYVPSAEIRLEPSAAGFSIEPPRVEVRGGEEQELTDLGRQGHGFQRAFVISVLEYLADAGATSESSNKPTLFLAIEEPELYQHPPRARHFFRTLATIADSMVVQVCYATHSPYFVSPERFDSLRIFRREDGAENSRDASVTAASLAIVTNKLPNTETADPRTYLARTLSAQFREGFFAKCVLLVEGPTDVAIFETAAEILELGSPASEGISIIPVGGKGSQPIALAILSALGIPTFCVFDGDANATDDTACPTCGRVKSQRTSAVAANRRILAALEVSETDFPDTTVGTTWACFHTEIEDAIEGLPTLLSEVKNEMGWKGKSPEVYAEAVRRVGAEALPDEVKQILEHTRVLAGLE
jgi:putative ATP-dependent endonuclease of the OLD family